MSAASPLIGFSWIEDSLCRCSSFHQLRNDEQYVAFLKQNSVAVIINVSSQQINDKLKALCSKYSIDVVWHSII